MTRCVLLGNALLLGLILPLPAQDAGRARQTQPIFSLSQTVGNGQLGTGATEIFRAARDRAFSLSNSFGWIGVGPAIEYLPALVTEEPRRNVQAPLNQPEAASKVVAVPLDPVSAHGEVGFLYGRSTGHRGGEVKQGYIIGEVGNDKIQVTAGASYEESSARFSRLRNW